MKKIDPEQYETPYLDALVSYLDSDPVPFDVPGHKLGSFETDLTRKLSPDLLKGDANAPIGLDNLYHPTGVIRKAEKLFAKACKADHCIFSVNGTTGGVLAMFLSCLDRKDKVILPRNVHKSVINALIVSGAVPIFLSPDIDESLGIANGVSVQAYIDAMDDNPTAKAVFVINPTYFGLCSDLKAIVREAHARNMIVMTDEAHGSNFYFSNKLPSSAMECGVDISSLSIHKNSGSLTQSSVILVKGKRVDVSEVKRAYAMLSSTSPNPYLIASLDAARKEMVIRGNEVIRDNLALSKYARQKINGIPGLHVMGKEVLNGEGTGTYSLDETKLVISVKGLGIYGYDAFKELRKYNNIQLELGEVAVVLALIGPGTTKEDIDRLIEGLEQLSKRHEKKGHAKYLSYRYQYPKSIVPPAQGYDAETKIVDFKDAIGEISSETVMAYPPGIPLLIPGELVTQETLRLIEFYEREGGVVLKDTQSKKLKIIDREKWYLNDLFVESN